MTIEEQLKQEILSKYKSVRAFTTSIQIPYTTLDSVFKRGVSNAGIETMLKVFGALDLDIESIKDGTLRHRDHFISPADKNAPSDFPEEALKIAKDYATLSDHGKGAVKAILTYEGGAAAAKEQEAKPQKVVSLPKAKRNHGMVEIKVYDQPAAAGLGNYLDEPVHHEEQYPDDVVPSKTDFGVVISGNSMEPKIHDGGTVFVEASPSIDSGKIGIFVLNGQAYCKKLIVDHENRQIRLVSLNPEYEDIVIQNSDHIRTIGRVLGQWTPGYPNDDIFGW